MAGSGGEAAAAAAARGHLRASRADRELVIDTLKVAFVQGRLARDEFDPRVSRALAARTHAELAALTADLPVGLVEAQPARPPVPAPGQLPVNKPLMWGSWIIVVLTVGAMVALAPTAYVGLLGFGVLPLLIAGPVAGTLTLDSWREKRAGGQPPPEGAEGGRALEGGQAGGMGDDLNLGEVSNEARARPGPDHLAAPVPPGRGAQRAQVCPSGTRMTARGRRVRLSGEPG